MASWKKVIVSGSKAELNEVTASGGIITAGDLVVSGGDITLGTTSIFSGGNTTSLNNIDAIDSTTEATIESALDTLSNVTTVGALDAGSITSGFGNIDNGTSTLNTGNATLDNVTNNSAVADSHFTGSFTGSFVGDGTGLTGTGLDIDGLSALGGTGLHQTQDHFVFSDNGTEKKITFSNLEDAIFGNVSSDVTIAAGGAATIANDAVDNNKLANITRGSIKVGGGSNAPTDLDAKTDGQILVGDGTDINSVAVSGDIGLANNGAVTIQANAVEGSMLNSNVAGTGLDYGSNELSVDVSDFMTNGSNNRVVTATGTDGMNGEANLTFDGSTLALTGAMTVSTNNTIAFRDSGLTIGSNADGDLDIVSDGTAVDSINIESAGGITLDAGTAGSGIIYEDDGTEMMRIHNSSSDVIVESKVSDKDIIFKVNDGGSSTEVARFDGDVSALLMASGKEIRFADSGEKISGNGTDLTLNSGADINLTATADVNIPSGVGVTFGDDGEKIEGDGTDLTIASSAKINLTATSDVHIPNNVGIVFGGDIEKIEGDGTDMTISANNLKIDAAADISLDAAGNDFKFLAGGTEILNITNSSSDVVIKPIVDAKDLIFQQRDGTEVMRIEDGAHVAFTAAALNPEATLTDASTISWNVLTSPVAKVTLGANRTLGAGTGAVTGSFQSLLVIQDGTGSRTLSFNAAYEFKDDTAPTLTTTASKGDLFVFRYNGSKFLEVGRNQNLTLS